jgi:hypothetical protein
MFARRRRAVAAALGWRMIGLRVFGLIFLFPEGMIFTLRIMIVVFHRDILGVGSDAIITFARRNNRRIFTVNTATQASLTVSFEPLLTVRAIIGNCQLFPSRNVLYRLHRQDARLHSAPDIRDLNIWVAVVVHETEDGAHLLGIDPCSVAHLGLGRDRANA